MANEARQRGDDDWGDDDGIFEEVGEELNDDIETGIYFGEVSREEPLIKKATIRWSGVGDKFIVIYSDEIDVLKMLGIPPDEGDISAEQIPVIENILISLGYEVEIERKSEEFFFY